MYLLHGPRSAKSPSSHVALTHCSSLEMSAGTFAKYFIHAFLLMTVHLTQIQVKALNPNNKSTENESKSTASS